MKTHLKLKLFILLLLAAAIPLVVIVSQQVQETRQRASETGSKLSYQSKQIEGLTGQLTESLDKYEKAKISLNKKEEETYLNSMLNIASIRKNELLKEIETNPAAFLQDAKFIDKRNSFPEKVKEHIEQEVNIRGKLVVLIAEDLKTQKSKNEYFLKENSNTYNLYFADNPPELLTDSVVVIKGIALNSKIALSSGKDSNERFTLKTEIAASVAPLGEQKTAVLLVNFNNNNSQPFTIDQLKQNVFDKSNSVNNYYKENSYNKIFLSGDVFGWYTLPVNNTGCNNTGWAIAADSLAKSAGVDIDSYNYRLYVFPQTDCWFAFATLGGNPARAWLTGSYAIDERTIAHEFGHNLGLHHANSLDCGSKTIDQYNKCTNEEYGDYFDVLGNQWMAAKAAHFNAPHKIAMNWISANEIQTINTNGVYTINSPLDSSGSGIKSLKIAKNTPNDYYYLEYKRGLGFNSGFPTGITRGVNIHVWDGDPYEQTKLLDSTPASSDFFKDSSLSDGASFTDSDTGIEVKQLNHNNDSATVEVKFTSLISPTPTSSPTPTLTPTPILPPSISFKLTPANSSVKVNDNFNVELLIDPNINKIIGVDLTLSFPKNLLELTRFEPTVALNNKLINEIVNENGTFRYSAVDTGGKLNNPNENVNLGTLTFKAKAQGNAAVNYSKTEATALDYDSTLSTVNNIDGKYTIIAAIKGDANGDGSVDIIDYNIWRDEFLGNLSTKKSDFDNNEKIDLADFNIWRNAFNPNPSPTTIVVTPTPTQPPQQSYRRVFITSTTYDGNLGGLTGADAKCQERASYITTGAQSQKIAGGETWKAWLSDSKTSAASRLTHFDGQYKLLNGNVVANNWSDLINKGSLRAPINITEYGKRTTYPLKVWTATSNYYGTSLDSVNCNNWGSILQAYIGVTGDPQSSDYRWTYGNQETCNQSAALYCFEQ